MIQLAVVKEQSAGGAMIWKLVPSEELCFGSEGSNKVEQLQITLPQEWADYTVRITFLPRGQYPVGIVLPQDGIIDIKADITSGAYGIGSFVLDAVQGEKVTYTVGGRYTVYTHPKAGGKDPEYTPDEYQQLVSQVKNAIPAGGATGQVLAKKSDADRDFAWEDQSGGEQVNPDWNQNDETAPDFVKNRPFYTGDPVFKELIPEQTVAFEISGSAGEALSPVNVDLVEGQTYQVVFDGQQYNCVCKAVSGVIYIGNGAALEQPDAGEPFIYANAEGNYLWLAFSGETEHTLSVTCKKAEIVQIPEKYLPESAFTNAEWEKISNKIVDYKQQSLSLSVSGESIRIFPGSTYSKNQINDNLTFEDGINYEINGSVIFYDSYGTATTLNVNGVYTCSRGNIELGSCYNARYEKDITVSLYSSDNEIYTGKLATSSSITGAAFTFDINITVTGEAKQLPDICIGENIQRVGDDIILSSSTSDSTKKFKITVDDTGTLSATEITE